MFRVINPFVFSGGGASLDLTGLVSWWSLDEASGDAIDSHGDNNLPPTGTPGSTTGKRGNARTFNGLQFFLIADNADFSTGDVDFSICLWLRFDDVSHFRHILGKWNAPASQREYLLRRDPSTGLLRFFVSPDGISSTSVASSAFGAVSVDTWYFVVCWHDSVNNLLGLSVNGVQDTLEYSSGVLDSTASFVLGGFQTVGSGVLHQGDIDEASFWKRVLTSDERAAIYNSGNGLAYPG